MIYDLSWANALLLSASIPSYKKPGDEDNEPVEVVPTADAAEFFK